MKMIADTHAHTLVSGHAYSTMNEMIRAGREHGLEVLALTEHAPAMPGSCNVMYFQNFRVVPRKLHGIDLLLGAELNIMDSDGTVDLSQEIIETLDIVIASIHTPCYGTTKSVEENTRAVIRVMENPFINIIGHPDDNRFPLDLKAIVEAAKETKTLLELNNSSLNPAGFRQGARENLLYMLELCKEYQALVTTGSDAHIDLDAGNFNYVQSLLTDSQFPEELVVTTDFEKLKPYLNRYKKW